MPKFAIQQLLRLRSKHRVREEFGEDERGCAPLSPNLTFSAPSMTPPCTAQYPPGSCDPAPSSLTCCASVCWRSNRQPHAICAEGWGQHLCRFLGRRPTTRWPRARAGVGEAPRHEVAGGAYHRCGALYGDCNGALPVAQCCRGLGGPINGPGWPSVEGRRATLDRLWADLDGVGAGRSQVSARTDPSPAVDRRRDAAVCESVADIVMTCRS
jgi:hypothetical protein